MTTETRTPPFATRILSLYNPGDASQTQHLYNAELDSEKRAGRGARALCGRPAKHTAELADWSRETCPDCMERVERIKAAGLYNLTNAPATA